jgi:hypothetical protein
VFTRIQVTVALALAAVAWSFVLWAQDTPLSREHLAPFSTVVGILVVVALVMEHWAWRLRIFQGWLFSRPNLIGTWKVTIESEWIDPTTNQKATPITAYAGVVQTHSKLQLHLMTPESESCLVANSITPTACGERFEIALVYANTPNVSLRGIRSERHVGAAIITTHGSSKYRPASMTAEYWTDRRTVGRMTFKSRVSTVYSRYTDAQAKLG